MNKLKCYGISWRCMPRLFMKTLPKNKEAIYKSLPGTRWMDLLQKECIQYKDKKNKIVGGECGAFS